MNRQFGKKLIFAAFLCLLWFSIAIAGTAQYTYDNLNRLVQVQYDDGTTIQYSYDAAGNRLIKQVTAFHASTPTTGPGSGLLAEALQGQNFPSLDWWQAIWGSHGKTGVTAGLPQ
jgi:YD repeat-containing protein